MAIVSADTTSFTERMSPVLEAALEKLSTAEFRADPIGGAKYSRATSLISSAYKRHGEILGRAILERLKDCHRFQVWTEDGFKISHASADELAKALPPAAYREVNLPYGEEEFSIPVDIIVYDTIEKTIRSYNVKRGNGSYDAGKRRIIFMELLKVQMLLSSYAKSFGLVAARAEAYAIFYYGLRSVPEPYSLVGNDLDEHFQFAVLGAVESVNAKLRSALHAMIESDPPDGRAV